eukprot:scaffold2984_cov452-Prasinococcus_capsulatus_cf.AAC.2
MEKGVAAACMPVTFRTTLALFAGVEKSKTRNSISWIVPTGARLLMQPWTPAFEGGLLDGTTSVFSTLRHLQTLCMDLSLRVSLVTCLLCGIHDPGIRRSDSLGVDTRGCDQ